MFPSVGERRHDLDWAFYTILNHKNINKIFSPSDYTVDEKPSEMLLIQELESGRSKPVVFVLNANLLAMVTLVNCTYFIFLV